MRDLAPWERMLIDLYLETKAESGQIPGTSYKYVIENGIMTLVAGNTEHWIAIEDI